MRRIDWDVTARTSDRTSATRSPTASSRRSLVDTIGDLAFGTSGVETRRRGADLADTFVSLPRGGTVSARCSRPSRQPGRPREGGSIQAAAVLAALGHAEADGGDFTQGLRKARRLARRRGMVVVVSDFLVPDGWQRELRALATRTT